MNAKHTIKKKKAISKQSQKHTGKDKTYPFSPVVHQLMGLIKTPKGFEPKKEYAEYLKRKYG